MKERELWPKITTCWVNSSWQESHQPPVGCPRLRSPSTSTPTVLWTSVLSTRALARRTKSPSQTTRVSVCWIENNSSTSKSLVSSGNLWLASCRFEFISDCTFSPHFCEVFSAPEPKAQVHYCDHVLSVVRPSICQSVVNFPHFRLFSETAEWNSTKLKRNQHLNILYQVCVFRADRKNKMAALASDWLRHFRLLLWNHWTEFNEI